MAQLQGSQSYDRTLRRDLEELANNMWLGQPINGQKAGNFRGIYLIMDLTGISAGTTFGVKHGLGDVPVGYLVVGTPTSEVVEMAPGVDSSGVRIAWTATRVYLKSTATGVEVTLLLWAGDSSGE